MHIANADSAAWQAACVVALVAVSISDALYRRIPNALSFVIWVMGCSYGWTHGGGSGLTLALEGSLVGFCMMLVLYAMGTIGAGDVKVFAGFGALLGPEQALWAGLYGLLVGGVLSLMAIYVHRMTFTDLRNGLSSLGLKHALHRARQRGTTVPLAAALAIGVFLVGAGYT